MMETKDELNAQLKKVQIKIDIVGRQLTTVQEHYHQAIMEQAEIRAKLVALLEDAHC